MQRRMFLKIGSASAAGPALWPARGFSFAGHQAVPYISVGYLPTESAIGAHPAGESETLGFPAITRAQNLARGDAVLADRGCRVEIHGLYPSHGAAERNGLIFLSLDVSYLPFQPVCYRAWTYENVLAANVGHPSAFRVPVTGQFGLNFNVTVRRAVNGTLVETEHAVRLSTGSERREAKLRPGTYFLGIHAVASSWEGKWERHQLGRLGNKSGEEDRWPVLRRPFPGFEPRPVQFPYLVLSVDYDGKRAEEIAW